MPIATVDVEAMGRTLLMAFSMTDAQSAGGSVGANAILLIRQHPRSRQPLLQAQRRNPRTRSSLQRELLLRVSRAALVNIGLGKKPDFIRTALRATPNPISPTDGDHELTAVLLI